MTARDYILSKIREQEDNRPTPETVAKLRHDVIQRMHARGEIDGNQQHAAMEIRQVWEVFGRGLSPRAVDPEAVNGTGTYVDPIARMNLKESEMWTERYRPWAREMHGRILGGHYSNITALQATLDVVVHNLGLRAVEAMHGLPEGKTAGACIRSALDRYAHIAGWA